MLYLSFLEGPVGLKSEMLQRDLCLCKGVTYPYTLFLFTVLQLVHLSLLAPSGKFDPRIVSLENRCSETQFRDPDIQAGSS